MKKQQENNVITVGNYTPSKHNASRIVDTKGIAPTVMENHGTITAIVEEPTIDILEATKKGYAKAKMGDGVYINRPQQKRGVVQKGMIQTIKANCDDVGVVVKDETLKTELCNKLIEEGKVKEGDIVKHSFSNQIMSGKEKAVRISGTISAITTRGDCLGVVVKDDTLFTDNQAKMIDENGNIKRYINSDKVDQFDEGQVADISFPNGYNKGKRTNNNCPAINTTTTDSSFITKISQTPLRIRKLTPCECMKLMGFTPDDYQKCKEIQSDSKIYHEAGDSIVSTCIVAMLGTMLDIDYQQKISDYVKELVA